MRKGFSRVALGVVLATAFLASCSSAPALGDWVQGTWACENTGRGYYGSFIIEIGDGTYEAPMDGDGWRVIDGTWRVESGQLEVYSVTHKDYDRESDWEAGPIPNSVADDLSVSITARDISDSGGVSLKVDVNGNDVRVQVDQDEEIWECTRLGARDN